MDTDPAIQELKKLREGAGLSVDRVAASPALMAALGTHDPAEAHRDLLAALERLGDGERVRTLRVDFGLDLSLLFGRESSGRERDLLGERRSTYSAMVGRDVKTLARWSDRALDELRALLITDAFDGHIIVAATVQNRRVAGIEVMRFEKMDPGFSNGRNIGSTNTEPGPSLPLVLFGYPPEWKPIDIRLVVAFMGHDKPTKAWTLMTDNVLDVGFGSDRTELEVVDGMARCRIENPVRDLLYGVWWEW